MCSRTWTLAQMKVWRITCNPQWFLVFELKSLRDLEMLELVPVESNPRHREAPCNQRGPTRLDSQGVLDAWLRGLTAADWRPSYPLHLHCFRRLPRPSQQLEQWHFLEDRQCTHLAHRRLLMKHTRRIPQNQWSALLCLTPLHCIHDPAEQKGKAAVT